MLSCRCVCSRAIRLAGGVFAVCALAFPTGSAAQDRSGSPALPQGFRSHATDIHAQIAGLREKLGAARKAEDLQMEAVLLSRIGGI